MLIQEFAELSGLSPDTLRFYEKKGLLQPERAPGGNGYRRYTENDLERVRDLRIAQALGFTLAEAKQGLEAMRQGKLTKAKKIAMIQSKLEEVERKAREMQSIATYLRAKLKWVEGGEAGALPCVPEVLHGSNP